MNITIPLQKPKDWNFACRTSASFTLSPAAEITFIHLDFTAHHGRFIADNFFVDGLAKLVKKEDRGVAIYTRQFGGRTRR